MNKQKFQEEGITTAITFYFTFSGTSFSNVRRKIDYDDSFQNLRLTFTYWRFPRVQLRVINNEGLEKGIPL